MFAEKGAAEFIMKFLRENGCLVSYRFYPRGNVELFLFVYLNKLKR